MPHLPFVPVKKCIFGCGRKANSREHGWSEWAKELLPDHGIFSEINGVTYHDPTQRHLRIKCVCVPCNTVWMNTLENAVRPVVTRMMFDHSVTLDIPQQWVISLWAIKHAMIFEFTDKETPPFYTDEERSAFRTDSRPPPNTAAWLARCPDMPGFYTRLNSFAYSYSGGPLYRLLYLTFAYRRLVVQVISIRPYEPHQNIVVPYRDAPRWKHHKLVIWPSRRQKFWPPRSSLREPDLLPFHKRFLSRLSTNTG